MVDQEKVQQAVLLLLEAVGEDPNREGLRETPERVARMYAEVLAGYGQEPQEILARVFPSQASDLVVERDIPFYSLCEHHLLPFFGRVHIAYLPQGSVVGLSKMARLVEVYARRLQLQEEMTEAIAEAMVQHLFPRGVLVISEAEHTCMTMRGIKSLGSTTVSTASRGIFVEDPLLEARARNLMLKGN
ncbi:GTP cyclohydrolase I type 1 [Clostridiaceae bacterium JG1575]|nr:GTP cyclohydrolase I type 1 [Clostridiaceae bacterium JG1575]